MECESNARIGIFCITIEYKSSCHTFSNILQKFNKLPFFGTLYMSGYFHQKLIIQLVEVLILMNFKMNSIHNFFLGYCKDIANLLLWVLWECLTMPITMPFTFSWSCLSPCRKFWCPKRWNQLKVNFDVYLHPRSQLHL